MNFSYHIVILNVVKNLKSVSLCIFRFAQQLVRSFAMLRMTRQSDSGFTL